MNAYDSIWLPNRAAASLNRIPVFCFPYAGGGASLFHQWQPLVNDVRESNVCEIVPVRLPGREGRIREAAFDNMRSLVDTVLQQLKSCWLAPHVLFGHSMGALIAYELAGRTTQAGHGPRLLILSSCRPPDQLRRDREQPLHELPVDAMIQQLLQIYGTAESVSGEETSLMRMLAPTLQADLKLIHNYERDPSPCVDCPVVVCGGADDPQVTRADLQGWQRYVSAKITTRIFPGGHFYLREQKTALIQFIQDRVRRTSE